MRKTPTRLYDIFDYDDESPFNCSNCDKWCGGEYSGCDPDENDDLDRKYCVACTIEILKRVNEQEAKAGIK
jgi:hypothetical protein